MTLAIRDVPLAPRQVLRAVLTEALESSQGGEVVVRSTALTGRVFVVEHRVAWVVLVGKAARSFTKVLVSTGLVSEDEVAQVMAECRKSGGNFCETLVAWGVVPRDVMRELLLKHFSALLQILFAQPEAQALFVPQRRTYASELTFDLAELMSEVPLEAADRKSQPPAGSPAQLEGDVMSNVKQMLEEAMKTDGAFAVCLADANSGMTLGSIGSSGFDIEAAAAGNTEVVRAKLRTMKALGLKDRIEDILITLGEQYHIIRPLASREGLFLYIALHRAQSNLAMARLRLADVEKGIQL